MGTKIREESYCDFCGRDRKIQGTLKLNDKRRCAAFFPDTFLSLDLCRDCFDKMMKDFKQKRDEAREEHSF